MPRAKAAQRVAAANVTATLATLLSPARAEASRRNGARSRGPKTADGKARSAQNALKHGLRAEKLAVVAGESAQAFAAFEAELIADLAPQGALQRLLAGRIARAAWRLERAERIEAELFARQMHGLYDDGDLGLALIRDGNGARAFETLLRYRGAAQAELTRALRTLKALQAEQVQEAALPNGPEARGNPGETASAADDEAIAAPDARQAGPATVDRACERRSETSHRSNPTAAETLARSALPHPRQAPDGRREEPRPSPAAGGAQHATTAPPA